LAETYYSPSNARYPQSFLPATMSFPALPVNMQYKLSV